MRVQITAATFDDPHPNDTHIPGVQYSPQHRCAFVQTAEGLRSAGIGDWIVRAADGTLSVIDESDEDK